MFFAKAIYCNNKPLIITNDRSTYVRQHPVADGYLSFAGAFTRHFRLAFNHLNKSTSLGAIIEDISPKALTDELHRLFEPIDAGGGVVTNEDGGVLMIYRRGKWDLPKGKLDEGEAIDECALREVSEETGLNQLTLGDKICDTYHVYSQGGENLLKRTAWYRMQGTKKEVLMPQKAENILEARWIAESDLAPVVFKSYEAIREVLKIAGFNW
ncbi:MAG: NUDIX domain-containing protein [Bacteroidetes bacterium]|nr:NUDIX domain-containing protein [Bacteroidota bacterium]MBS1740849.1 NUDIX domain-containing protein [Bacteroidota bacterium]